MYHVGAHYPFPPQPSFQEACCTPYYITALDDTRVIFHSRYPVNTTPLPYTITGIREGHRALQLVSAVLS